MMYLSNNDINIAKEEILLLYNLLDNIQPTTSLNIDTNYCKIKGSWGGDHTGANIRYNTEFANSDYEFFSKYFRDLKSAFFNEIKYKCICTKDYGYQYPTEKEIDIYLDNTTNTKQEKESEKPMIINKDFKTAKQTINTFLEGKHNRMFLLGKVGSGKSTFIKLLQHICTKDFKDNVVFINIEYEKSLIISEFINDIKQDSESIDNKEKDLIFKKLKFFFQQELLKGIVKLDEYDKVIQKKLENTKGFFDLLDFKDITNENFQVFIERGLNQFDFDDTQQLFDFFIEAFLEKNKKIKFVYSVDGLDILNPALEEEYKTILNILIDKIYDYSLSQYNHIIEKIYFITTFRSCTANSININADNEKIFKLAPPSVDRLLVRAVKYMSETSEKNFYKNYEKNFIKLLNISLDAIREYVVLDNYKENVVGQFDYDYRMLFEYIFQIQCYAISSGLLNYRRLIRRSEDDLSLYLKSDDELSEKFIIKVKNFLDRKKYIIVDILLLKNSSLYRNPYKLENLKITLNRKNTRKYENHNINLFNNIFNYLHKSENGTFPFLIKYRLLQLLYLYSEEGSYTYDENLLYKRIKHFGYGFSKENFRLIITELVVSKFISLRKFGIKLKYHISNKGKLVLELAKKSAYYQHVISMSLIPKNDFTDVVFPYTPNKVDPRRSLLIGIKDSLSFLLLIKFVESAEKENLLENNLYEKYQGIFIYDDMKKNTEQDIQHIINGFKGCYKETSNNIQNNGKEISNRKFREDIEGIKLFFIEQLKGTI